MSVTFLLSILLMLALLEPNKSTKGVEYNVMPMEADWASAVDTCLPSKHLLMPDLGKDFFQSEISEHMETGEVFWMNAKSVEIMYTDQPVYLKFAYLSEDTKLSSYLCHKASTRETKNNISNVPLSWQDAKKLCTGISKWTLYDVSSPKQAKMTVSLLRKDAAPWVNKISRQKIPNMVSDELHMTEDCLGVIKLEDGTLDYRRDNCTNKHKFVCVSSPGKYAPTITKMSEPYLFVFEEPRLEIDNRTLNTSGAEDSGMNAAVLGGSIGGSLGGIILIFLSAILVYNLHKRWRSRRDYLRSLQRYTQGQSGSRRLQSNTGTGSLPLGSSCYNSQGSRVMANPEEYEEFEKRPYAQCQKDVVQDLKYRYARYPSGKAKKSSFGASTGQANYPSHGASTGQPNYPSYDASTEQPNYPSHGASTYGYGANHLSQGKNAELEKLPAYHTMDGTMKVLPAYETYDPDIGHLQQVCGYVNKNDHPKLSQLDQYDNVPTLPVKTGKQSALNELDQYENQSPGNLKTVNGRVESKPLDDTARNTVTSLDDLEKYENYNLPKRKIGLFQLLKASKAKQAAKEAKSKANVEPDSLNDLEAYEKYEPPSVTQKENHDLENLDAYENYTLKK